MNFSSSAQSRIFLAIITLCALLGACGSVPTSAPVIERSPNAGTKVKAAPANPVTTAVSTSPAGDAQVVVTGSRSEPLPPPKIEKQLEPVAANSLPATEESAVTKPYREGDWRPEYHIVTKGDTLYSIALDYGQDYRELAAWNNLADPGLIKIDQRLRLFAPDNAPTAATSGPVPLAPVAAKPSYAEPRARKLPYSEQVIAQLQVAALKSQAGPGPAAVPATQPSIQPAPATQPMPQASPALERNEVAAAERKMTWEWPAQGRLLYGFGQGANQKGVGIEGRSGQPVLAAAAGKVVYSGSGLRGYGKLIIVKHNASYLSVYAHNSQILVKEGQTVAKGQKIAEIGSTDSDRVALHFEIRRLGKPIDPLQYLPEKPS